MLPELSTELTCECVVSSVCDKPKVEEDECCTPGLRVLETQASSVCVPWPPRCDITNLFKNTLSFCF